MEGHLEYLNKIIDEFQESLLSKFDKDYESHFHGRVSLLKIGNSCKVVFLEDHAAQIDILMSIYKGENETPPIAKTFKRSDFPNGTIVDGVFDNLVGDYYIYESIVGLLVDECGFSYQTSANVASTGREIIVLELSSLPMEKKFCHHSIWFDRGFTAFVYVAKSPYEELRKNAFKKRAYFYFRDIPEHQLILNEFERNHSISFNVKPEEKESHFEVFKKKFSDGFGGISFEDAIPKNYHTLFENLKLSEKFGKIGKIMKDIQKEQLRMKEQEKYVEGVKYGFEKGLYNGYHKGVKEGRKSVNRERGKKLRLDDLSKDSDESDGSDGSDGENYELESPLSLTHKSFNSFEEETKQEELVGGLEEEETKQEEPEEEPEEETVSKLAEELNLSDYDDNDVPMFELPPSSTGSGWNVPTSTRSESEVGRKSHERPTSTRSESAVGRKSRFGRGRAHL
jgi:hypothetical protein